MFLDPGGDTFEAGDEPHGVCVAFYDDALEPNPVWTRLDDPAGYHLVQSWSITRGRSMELDKVEGGTASITLIDKEGVLDPTNNFGPFWQTPPNGSFDPMRQAAIGMLNPATGEWETLFRGFVDEWIYDLDVSEGFFTVELHLIDAFGYLAQQEMVPGYQGDDTAPITRNQIFFPGGNDTEPYTVSTFKHVDQRILEILSDASWPLAWTNIFSGNVTVQATVYSRLDYIQTAMQEAADAEFPGVANIFTSKRGIVTFHGRFARFNYARPEYGINQWRAGDASAFQVDADYAPLASLQMRRSSTDIYNAVVAVPKGHDDWDAKPWVADQLVKDNASIARFGWRSLSFESLLTFQGHDEDDVTTDAKTETKRFGTFYVSNFAWPRTRVTSASFRPRDPDGFSGPALWGLVCGVELGDVVNIVTQHPGGGGIGQSYFVEGIKMSASPMTKRFPNVNLSLDLSPSEYFDEGFGTDTTDPP